MRAFEKLGLDSTIVEQLGEIGIETPTPIQAEAIPLIIEGKDIIGRARTGSGKTAAFGLPIIQSVDGPHVFSLILCPTRELAIQVTNELEKYNPDPDIRFLTVYGGASFSQQERALRKGVSIVVGTPGRVIDHLKRKTMSIAHIRFAVLDEADEMLRMGFLEDVETILGYANKARQTLLFSATMPKQIQRVAKEHLNNPVVVQVESENLTTAHIEQKYIIVPFRKKMDALLRMLAGTERGACLVFTRTKKTCAAVADELSKRGFASDALHGDLHQGARERTLNRLRAKHLDIVVATDVAARGIDVNHLTHVFNFDLTRDAETYVHRIGRTGRAGRAGTAITFVTPSERRLWKDISRAIKISPEETQMPSKEEISAVQRGSLEQKMFGDQDFAAQKDARQWFEALVDSGVEPSEVAVAALTQLMPFVGFDISHSDVDLTGRGQNDGSRDRGRRGDRGRDRDRGRGKERGRDRGRGDRGNDRERGRREDRKSRRAVAGDKEALNQVEIYLDVGRRDRVRPNDIVGAIANQADVKGTSIGRVDIGTNGTWVGLPREVATHILANYPEITVKGRLTDVVLSSGNKSDSPKHKHSEVSKSSPRKVKRPAKSVDSFETQSPQDSEGRIKENTPSPKKKTEKPLPPKKKKLSKKAKAKKRGSEKRKTFPSASKAETSKPAKSAKSKPAKSKSATSKSTSPKEKSEEGDKKKQQGKFSGKSFYKKKSTSDEKKRFPKFVKDNTNKK